MRAHFHRGYHGTNLHNHKTEPMSPVKGPKFSVVKLNSVYKPSTGYRAIFYLPSGAWFFLDVYFDRRKLN